MVVERAFLKIILLILCLLLLQKLNAKKVYLLRFECATRKSNFEPTLYHNESLSSKDLIQGKNDFSSEEDRSGE